MRNRLLIPIFFLLTCGIAQAKEYEDTTYLPDSFYATFGNDLPVYSGRLFLGYLSKIKGSPYIPETGWDSGSVWYNNIRYKLNSLKLDVHTGELILQTPTQFSIIPADYRIKAFTLGERKFVRIDSVAKSATRPGFYEILEEGALKVIARRQALLEQKIDQLVLESEFLRKDEFFLQKNSELTKVLSKRHLYNLLKDKKKVMKKTLKRAGLSFRKNEEAFILKAVETYNLN